MRQLHIPSLPDVILHCYGLVDVVNTQVITRGVAYQVPPYTDDVFIFVRPVFGTFSFSLRRSSNDTTKLSYRACDPYTVVIVNSLHRGHWIQDSKVRRVSSAKGANRSRKPDRRSLWRSRPKEKEQVFVHRSKPDTPKRALVHEKFSDNESLVSGRKR